MSVLSARTTMPAAKKAEWASAPAASSRMAARYPVPSLAVSRSGTSAAVKMAMRKRLSE